MATVSIKDNIYKTIIKLAKKENTTEYEIINEILEIGIETKENIEDKYDCDSFEKDLKEARKRVKKGESTNIEDLAAEIGIDLDEKNIQDPPR